MSAAVKAPPAKGTEPTVPTVETSTGAVIATVARGRTVIDDEGLKRGGEEAILSEADYRKLVRLGYVVDPDAPVIPEGNGPSFSRGS